MDIDSYSVSSEYIFSFLGLPRTSSSVHTWLLALPEGEVMTPINLLSQKNHILVTWYSPRCHLCSHSLVFIKNHVFIVLTGPIINKELEFIYLSDLSDCTCSLSYVTVL